MTRWAKLLACLSPSLEAELHDRLARANTAEIMARGWERQLRENGIEPVRVFTEYSTSGGSFTMMMTSASAPTPRDGANA